MDRKTQQLIDKINKSCTDIQAVSMQLQNLDSDKKSELESEGLFIPNSIARIKLHPEYDIALEMCKKIALHVKAKKGVNCIKNILQSFDSKRVSDKSTG